MIVKYPNKILETVCEEVTIEEAQQIAELLRREIDKEPDAVGLAAPQIGITKKVFSAMNQIYVNPKIIHYSIPTNIAPERCLSIPGKSYNITRSVAVVIEYMNLKGKKKTKTLSGFEARVVQHEYDHLLGKLINQDGK